jgi:molybdopterin/thiamine biosynthesis adenylyltransferase
VTVTVVLSADALGEIRRALGEDVETGAVVLARLIELPGGDLRLLVRDVIWVPDDAYVVRSPNELVVESSGYVPALAAAEADGCTAIWLHTHPEPGASPSSSPRDDIVDMQLAPVFRLRTDSAFYGALIVSHGDGAFRFTGHVETDSARRSIDRIWATGPRLSLIAADEHAPLPAPERFDRNIRAFGGDIQRVLGDLRVAVVGLGGTGSAVAEQLVRLGVRRFVLIDPDTISESNVTRVYGSTPGDEGRPKVEVAADHLHRIAPDADIEPRQSMVTLEPTARALTNVDLVFGCTDDNAGRAVLSRLASYLLTPVIDCGVLLSATGDGVLVGVDGRVTVLAPGNACLICRDRIDLRRAAAELLTPDERRRLADEGYAPELPGVEPAVVAFTTLVASTAVGELLERLIGYGPDEVPSEVLLRLHEREVSTNSAAPRPGHYCDPGAGKLGAGTTPVPFLEQTWPE